MNIRSRTAVAACLVAAVTAGCGTVTASSSGGGTQPTAVQATMSAGHATASAAATRQSQAPSAVTATRSGCQHLAADSALTLASNSRTYCIGVGEHFSVYLRGTLASRWLVPLASSNVIVGAPNGAMSLIAGLTGASFAGARPGQALITSVRPPCAGSLRGKNEFEPSGPLPKTYPLHVCAPQRRFSVVIVVLP